MKDWVMINMSSEYHSRLNSSSVSDQHYGRETFEFWRLGDDLLPVASRIYSLDRFHGSETGGGPDIPALLIEFGPEAVVATATLIHCLVDYLRRNESRELTIERAGTKLTLKGRSLPEEKELLHMLFPEIVEDQE